MIVGVSGLPRSGKDTFAEFLVKNHGFEKFSIARRLKICYALEILKSKEKDEEKLLNLVEPQKNEIRRNLIDFGSSRDWFMIFLQEYADKIRIGKNFIISDIRKVNEIEWVINNGKYVQIYGRGEEFDSPVEQIWKSHTPHYVIINDKDKANLEKETEDFIKWIG